MPETGQPQEKGKSMGSMTGNCPEKILAGWGARKTRQIDRGESRFRRRIARLGPAEFCRPTT